jgi:Ca2+-binding EF-hand superfamily protein
MPARILIAISAVALLVSAPVQTTPSALAQEKTCKEMKAFDPDNDGTMDLNEAKAAASKLFEKLNPDKDGTLDQKELKGHMTAKELQAANPDNDGTLDKAEFLAEVEKRFKAANPDNDGTIDCKELGSAAGKALMKLLR